MELFDFEMSPVSQSMSDIFSEPIIGEIRRTKGELVENVNVSVSDGTRKVIVSAIPSTPIQVTASTSVTHSLGSSSGQDAVDLAAELHTPPSHSEDSQQPTVSEILVSLAPNLAPLHSGGIAIETRSSSSPTSTSIERTSSLEPSREHESLHTESLRGPIGTSIVMSMSGIPRGLEGNPTSATSHPTLT